MRTKLNQQSDVRASSQLRNAEAGFSILETAIALVLMSIVALGAASLFYFSIRNAVTASDRDLAMAVAQQKMEQLRNIDFLDAALTATAGAPPATVTRAGLQYQVFTTIADSNVINGQATTKTITVRVAPLNDPASWSSSITSYFGSVTVVAERSALSVGPNRAL